MLMPWRGLCVCIADSYERERGARVDRADVERSKARGAVCGTDDGQAIAKYARQVAVTRYAVNLFRRSDVLVLASC